MMLKNILIFSFLIITSPIVNAVEEWSGHSTVPAGMGWPDYTMSIKLILEDASSVAGGPPGKVELTGQMKCRSEAELLYLRINGDSVEIRSKPLPTHGCGYFYFKGNVVNGEWVGKMPWNGRQNDLIFKKH